MVGFGEIQISFFGFASPTQTDGDFEPPFETFSSALELLIGCTEPVADEQAEVVMSAHSSRRQRSKRT